MAKQRRPLDALRVELYAPIASFRDPLFPGVTRCLPVPPPSTLRGMLAAATGRPRETVVLGVAAHAGGGGIDTETYHPIAASGLNPAIGGRVLPGKGGVTVRERPFLADVRVALWIPAPEGERIAAALRRPVWGLRLGRSQDLVHLKLTWTALEPAGHAEVGHALAPPGGHEAPNAVPLRLADLVSPDRLRTSYATYLWCEEPTGLHDVRNAYRDTDPDYRSGQQAVWLHDVPDHDEGPELHGVSAKSAPRFDFGPPERLTEHSTTVRDAAREVADRIASPGVLATAPRFWSWVEQAALLHDTGKVAESFQIQLRDRDQPWGHRHEVLSLAYVDLLTTSQTERDRLMVASGVAFHHRQLSSQGMKQVLDRLYPEDFDDTGWERIFGRDPHPPPGQPRVQVVPTRHRELLSWLGAQLGIEAEPGPGDGPDRRRLWQRARALFLQLCDTWHDPVDSDEGLRAVLLQGAVTLADRSGSARVALQRHMPLPRRYLERLPAPYAHQRDAERVADHLVLVAPTGSGKTEAGLAWASRQLDTMPGRPRLVWVLPYRASIDAAVQRFTDHLDAAPGRENADIGVLHATAAATLLDRATADDCAPTAKDAGKARHQVAAMRLFAQRVRVATPHQLLRAAIAGPKYSSVLLDQANCLFVLDELHAYQPEVFGRICAAMRLWQTLGSRVAVLSATLAQPMIDLIQDSLRPSASAEPPVPVLRAPNGTAPDRHRLVMDADLITDPASIGRIAGWLREGHSVLVVANTVATAQKLYDHLAGPAREALPGDPDAAVLLHSRFKACDRAAIEKRIKARHPERGPGDPAGRGGGLVVSTQVLEVSLCLDFDRGVTELAPVEALAQRAGRVNRRGRHPDGLVEFRVHDVETPLPYEQDAVGAARQALRRTLERAPDATAVISEQTIHEWLEYVYDTPWGRRWADEARDARDEFTRGFLTFTMPFEDRSDVAGRLDEEFDTVNVLHADDRGTYQELSTGDHGDPLLAARLLIPISIKQRAMLDRSWHLQRNPAPKPDVTDAPYAEDTGLDLSVTRKPAPLVETIL